MNQNSKQFVAQYAKAHELSLTDAEDAIIAIGASRINALRRYANRLKKGEVSPPSLAKRTAKPKAAKPKAAPKAKPAPKAKAPKVKKAKAPAVPAPAPAPGKVSAMDEGGIDS